MTDYQTREVDDAIAWLQEQGRSPLELVFIPPAADLWEKWPSLFSEWTKAKQRKHDKNMDLRQAHLQWALEDYIQAMPADLKEHLRKLVEAKIEQEVKKALESRQVTA